MTDLASTIIPKSDQMNSDDLISGPRTIRVTKVSADTGSTEQPILIHYECDGGKPWKPCKSMRRVLVTVWGANGSQYPGRSLTLYRDPSVKWGGLEVGGIRISHMSHMDGPVTLALTATKQSRKPFTVKPLATTAQIDPIDAYAKEFAATLKGDVTAAQEWWSDTADRREALNIPIERLDKMTAALTKLVEKA